MDRDSRIGGHLGRILDASGEPVGTCFQLADRIVATAWHVLDELDAGHEGASVDVDPLAGGSPVSGRVINIDPTHDLAVMRLDKSILVGQARLFRSDKMTIRSVVSVTGVANVRDSYSYRFIEAEGIWAGGTTRDGEVRLGRVKADAVMPGMSGAPVLDPYGLVVGVVSGRYNSDDGWLRDSVWVARTESLLPLIPDYASIVVRERVLGASARLAATKGAAPMARRLLGGKPRADHTSTARTNATYTFHSAYDARVGDDLLLLVGTLLQRVTDAEPSLIRLRKSRLFTGAIVAAVQAIDGLAIDANDEGGFDFDSVARILIERAERSTDHFQGLGESDRLAVHEVLASCCVALVEQAIATEPVDQAGVSSAGELSFTRLPARSEGTELGAQDASFREVYLRNVAGRLKAVSVQGLTLNRRQKREYRLSSSYVNLSMQLAQGGDPKSKVVNDTVSSQPLGVRTGLTVEEVLHGRRLVLIEGPAGAGKTTLLRRLALYCAEGEAPEGLPDLSGLVPFLLPARNLDPRRLPRPEAFVGIVSDYEGLKPDGWVSRLLADGQAIVLIDGLDEVEGPLRPRILDWAESLTVSFPRTRFVMTSRPATMNRGLRERLVGKGFISASIDPMTPRQVDDFIEKWHESESTDSSDELQSMQRAADGLRTALVSRRDLQRLATTPLLCAMLCALNLNADRWIPRGRTLLYQESLAMLLERRDRAREVSTFEFNFDHTQVELLLRKLAYWMTSEGTRWMHREIALHEIAPLIPNFRGAFLEPPPAAERVLDFLVERSGLLQEPTVDTLEFLHPSFQDYLAAAEITSHSHVQLLANRIDDPLYHDVIAMAVGLAATANKGYFDQLLSRLLRLAESRQMELERMMRKAANAAESGQEGGVMNRETIDRLDEVRAGAVYVWFLLSAALADVGYVDRDVEQKIYEATRDLLPPSSADDARMLAALGGIVLDPLGEAVSNSSMSEDQEVATVLVGTLIASHEVLPLLRWFRGSPNRDVQQALLHGLNNFQDKGKYATEILAFIPEHNTLEIALDDPRDIAIVSRLGCVGSVAFKYECGNSDLARISSESKLYALDLSSTDVSDLTPLSALSSLLSLDVSDTPVSDLTPISSLGSVQCLNVSDSDVADASALTTFRSLGRLDIANTQVSDLSFLASSEKLVSLNLSGAPVDKLDVVAELGMLEDLNLFGSRVRTLAPLSRCHSLRVLDAGGTMIRNVRPLAALHRLEELHLESTGVRDLSPLFDLPNLRKIVLNGSESVFDGICRLRSKGVMVVF